LTSVHQSLFFHFFLAFFLPIKELQRSFLVPASKEKTERIDSYQRQSQVETVATTKQKQITITRQKA